MGRRKTGISLIVISLLLWLIEKPAQSISSFIGQTRCGDEYMQAVEGIVGEQSCGFNDEMYIASLLLIMVLSGFILHITSKQDQV